MEFAGTCMFSADGVMKSTADLRRKLLKIKQIGKTSFPEIWRVDFLVKVLILKIKKDTEWCPI